MINKLFLQEIQTTDCRILTFRDSSYYNPDLEIENGILEITPPGFKCAVFFNVKPCFTITLNSSNLKITPVKKSSQLACLPDGIYKIKYSINPNCQMNVEYDFFRNTQQVQSIHRAICSLYAKKCDLTKKCFEQRRREIIWIKELSDAAKYKIEECGDRFAGTEMYNEANRLLKDLNNCSSC